jgi:type IV pilus assembly protein PilP
MRRALLFISLLPVGIAACGGPTTPAAPAPTAAKKDAPKADAPKPAAVTAEAPPPFIYTYVPAGKRDPFRNPLEELEAAGNRAENPTTTCNQPLCRWDLDQLKLVGVVSGMSNPLGMVEDPQGVGHMVRRNTFMGKKGGRVTAIKHDSVVVTEISRDGNGKPRPSDTTMHLAVDASAAEMQDLLPSEGNE